VVVVEYCLPVINQINIVPPLPKFLSWPKIYNLDSKKDFKKE